MSSQPDPSVDYDSLFSALLSMGFETEYVQQYLHFSKKDRVEPTLHDAINYLLSHNPSSSVSDSNTNLRNNDLLIEHSQIESGIPTVIGYTKSITFPVTSSRTETPVNYVLKPSVIGQNEEEREKLYKRLRQDRKSLLKHKQIVKEMIEHDREEKLLGSAIEVRLYTR